MSKTDPWIPGNLPTSTKVYRDKPGQFGGFSIAETAASTAKVRLWDNTSAASGTLLATITLAANGSLTKELKWGVRFLSGLYVEVVSGAVEGVLYTN